MTSRLTSDQGSESIKGEREPSAILPYLDALLIVVLKSYIPIDYYYVVVVLIILILILILILIITIIMCVWFDCSF